MSSAATTLSTLLSRPVQITTPTVDLVGEAEVRREFDLPAVVVTIEHTEGLDGHNLFILTTRDASVVADLMMGGDGTPFEDLGDLHTSAIGEAMNQMMGSAATAMAEMAGRRVDISSPVVEILDLSDDASVAGIGLDPTMVRTSFQLRVGDLLDTRLMQLMPVPFARALVDGLLAAAPGSPAPPAGEDDDRHLHALPAPPLAQPVAFPSLDEVPAAPGGSDISLLLDVPLQVTVELGRTQLRIRNVLELVPGSIVELDKLAGEPVDVLVNGKQIARGEVVVIDEEFGVRITDVASQAKRLRGLAADEGQ
jgi:flagellar motor switch protein FliN/FliY